MNSVHRNRISPASFAMNSSWSTHSNKSKAAISQCSSTTSSSVTSYSIIQAVVMGHLGLACEGDSIEHLLEEHPIYLDAFSRLHSSLMEGDGPLPEHVRRYIAIMAACRHECSFLVEGQKAAFLEARGPAKWLQGLQYTPAKLRELHSTNVILAHQPWLFSQHHVEKLLKSNWSVSELSQAICIMAQFHSLSSFVHGCGIEASCGYERTHIPSYMQQLASGSPSSLELSEGGLDVLMQRMKTICVAETNRNINEEITRTSFERLKKQTCSYETPIVSTHVEHPYENLSPDAEIVYVDFAKRGEKSSAPTLKSQDYSWEEHGFSLVNALYSEIGDLLDDKFKTAYNLTYYTFGHNTQVDTTPFRRGIWHYLHCLYGIRNDDYDYGQINQLLERNLKMFLKTVACYPERLSSCDENSSIMKDFMHSEKVHVLVLVLEARLQAELLHSLRALAHYLT